MAPARSWKWRRNRYRGAGCFRARTRVKEAAAGSEPELEVWGRSGHNGIVLGAIVAGAREAVSFDGIWASILALMILAPANGAKVGRKANVAVVVGVVLLVLVGGGGGGGGGLGRAEPTAKRAVADPIGAFDGKSPLRVAGPRKRLPTSATISGRPSWPAGRSLARPRIIIGAKSLKRAKLLLLPRPACVTLADDDDCDPDGGGSVQLRSGPLPAAARGAPKGYKKANCFELAKWSARRELSAGGQLGQPPPAL